MDRRACGLAHELSNHFFGTSTGRRRDPDRFRDRILARGVERANTNREQNGLPPLPAITPHSLRRIWATFAARSRRTESAHPRQATGAEKGTFDRAIERLTDAVDAPDEGE